MPHGCLSIIRCHVETQQFQMSFRHSLGAMTSSCAYLLGAWAADVVLGCHLAEVIISSAGSSLHTYCTLNRNHVYTVLCCHESMTTS